MASNRRPDLARERAILRRQNMPRRTYDIAEAIVYYRLAVAQGFARTTTRVNGDAAGRAARRHARQTGNFGITSRARAMAQLTVNMFQRALSNNDIRSPMANPRAVFRYRFRLSNGEVVHRTIWSGRTAHALRMLFQRYRRATARDNASIMRGTDWRQLEDALVPIMRAALRNWETPEGQDSDFSVTIDDLERISVDLHFLMPERGSATVKKEVGPILHPITNKSLLDFDAEVEEKSERKEECIAMECEGAHNLTFTKILSPVTKDDNCALDAILVGIDKMHMSRRKTIQRMIWAPTKEGKQSTWRRDKRKADAAWLRRECGLNPKGPIEARDLQKVVDFLCLNIQVFSCDMTPIFPRRPKPVNEQPYPATVRLMLDVAGNYSETYLGEDNKGIPHYWLMLGEPLPIVSDGDGCLNYRVVRCKVCRQLRTLGHRCSKDASKRMKEGKPSQDDIAEACQKRKDYLEDPNTTDEDRKTYFRVMDTIFEKHGSISFTGPGGTGKSFLIDMIGIEATARGYNAREVTRAAPTGVAAENIDGITIHRLANLINIEYKDVATLERDYIRQVKDPNNNRAKGSLNRLADTNILILDEVSMADAKLLDVLNLICQYAKGNALPFGGIQLVFSFDVMQLAPVNGRMFFQSLAWRSVMANMDFLYLTKTFRFKEQEWADILYDLRRGIVSKQGADVLKDRVSKDIDAAVKDLRDIRRSKHKNETESENFINSVRFITATNARCNELNDHITNKYIASNAIEKIDVIARDYSQTAHGRAQDNAKAKKKYASKKRKRWQTEAKLGFDRTESDNSLNDPQCYEPTRFDAKILEKKNVSTIPYKLMLAVGFPVVYTSDNRLFDEYNVANGHLGYVKKIDLESETPTVYVYFPHRHKLGGRAGKAGKGVELVPISMTKTRYMHRRTKCYREQFPLRLAFCMTIHKSQGKTLDYVCIDMTTCLQPGQAYVAMSRVRSMHNLRILNIDLTCFNFHKECLNFDDWTRNDKTADENSIKLGSENTGIDRQPMHYTDYATVKLKLKRNSSMRKRQRQLLHQKTCYFDLETFHDGIRERAYYCYALIDSVNQKGESDFTEEQAKKYWSKVDDPEIDVIKEFTDWFMDLVLKSRDNYAKSICHGHASSSVKWHEIPWTLCAYNGSNFDFHFFLKNFMERVQEFSASNGQGRFLLKPTLKGKTVVMLDVLDTVTNTTAFRVHDLCQILKSSLSSAASSFLKDKNVDKDCFPHTWVTQNWQRLHEYKDKPVTDLKITDFPKGHHRDVAREKIAKGELELNNWHFNKELKKYGEMDVLLLKELYQKIDDLSIEIVGAPILEFNTIAQMTWYGTLKYMYDDLPAARYTATDPPIKSTRLGNGFEKIVRRIQRKQKIGIKEAREQARERLGKDIEFAREAHVDDSIKYFDIHRLTRALDAEIDTAMTGGRTLPRALHWTSTDIDKPYDQIKDFYAYVDFVSMYPWAMINCTYPCGKYELYRSGSDKLADFERKWRSTWCKNRDPCSIYHQEDFPLCLMKISYTPNPYDLEPNVGTKRKDKETGSTNLRWGCEPVIEPIWKTSIDALLIERSGGSIDKIGEVIWWPKRLPLYRAWVSECFRRKQAADEAGNEPVRQFCKILANSAFGSQCKGNHDTVHIGITSMQQLTDFHHEYEWMDTINHEQVADRLAQGLPPGTLMLKGKKKVLPNYSVSARPREHGMFTLAFTRWLLADVMEEVNPDARSGTFQSIFGQPLYGDTDSVMVPAKALPALMHRLGKEVGDLDDDLQKLKAADYERIKEGTQQMQWAKIVMCASPRPKCYGLRYVTPDNKAKDKIKLAAINMKNCTYHFADGTSTDKIGFPEFFRIVNANSLQIAKDPKDRELERVTVSMPDRLIKCGVKVDLRHEHNKPFDLTRGDLVRTLFKTQWNGRAGAILHPNGRSLWTVPHGWRGVTTDPQKQS